MKRNISIGFVIVALLAAGSASADDLRVVTLSYDMAAATQERDEPTHVICATCPKPVPYAQAIKKDVIVMKAPAEDPISPQRESITCVKGAVHFGLGSASISKNAANEISEVVSKVKGKEVTVEGFTCDLGSQRVNNRLAKKRAQAVAKQLKRAGVQVENVSGTGKCCYVSDKKQENRRVEVQTKEAVCEE